MLVMVRIVTCAGDEADGTCAGDDADSDVCW